jgi:type IV conjugative transfer system protein TraL
MQDNLDTQIVSGLKDPWKFLFVDMDVAMAAAGVGFLLLTVGLTPPFVLGGGAGFGYFLQRLRKGKPRGYARHLRYWHFPPSVNGLRRIPRPWAQRTIG